MSFIVSSFNEELVISKIKGFFENDVSGHDWWHVQRVVAIAVQLAEKEKANVWQVKLIAYLHDVDDVKLVGKEKADVFYFSHQILEELGVEPATIAFILSEIKKLSFKGAGISESPESLEGKIVQDADRIDALGAIGIARTFAYGGAKGQKMFDPSIPVMMHEDEDSYRSKPSTSINHFYEKLFLLKDRMNTNAGKVLAEKRHQFIEEFVQQFQLEWGTIE